MESDKWLKTYLEDRFASMDGRFEKVEAKLDHLAKSYWFTVGKIVGASSLIILLAEIVLRLVL